MNLDKYKFEHRNDKAIFKALIRCYKDDGKLCNFYKNKRGIKYIIDCCYSSRRRHPDESYQTNIHFWPNDIPGGSFINDATNFLYAVRLINSVKAKPTTTLKNYFEEKENDFLEKFHTTSYRISLKRMPSFYSFYDEIYKAYVRCGISKKIAEDKTKAICNAACCVKENIPL